MLVLALCLVDTVFNFSSRVNIEGLQLSCCLRRVSSDSIVTLKRRSLWLGVGCVGWHRRTGKRLIAVTLTSVRMSMTSNPSITRTARATPVGAARPCDFVLNIVADWTVAVDNDAVTGRPAVD